MYLPLEIKEHRTNVTVLSEVSRHEQVTGSGGWPHDFFTSELVSGQFRAPEHFTPQKAAPGIHRTKSSLVPRTDVGKWQISAYPGTRTPYPQCAGRSLFTMHIKIFRLKFQCFFLFMENPRIAQSAQWPDYELGNPGFEFRSRKRGFFSTPKRRDQFWGPLSLLFGTGFCVPGGKADRAWGRFLPSNSAKNMWSYTCTLTVELNDAERDKFIFSPFFKALLTKKRRTSPKRTCTLLRVTSKTHNYDRPNEWAWILILHKIYRAIPTSDKCKQNRHM